MAQFANFSDCFEGSQFIAIEQPFDQTGSKVVCISLDATLARISNERENTFLATFLDIVSDQPNQEYWIGEVLYTILI